MARDHCTPASCAAFRSLGDTQQIASNMDDRVYENLITRYAPSWNAPAIAAAGTGLIAALPPSMPTGKPTNAEFPICAVDPAGQHHDAGTRCTETASRRGGTIGGSGAASVTRAGLRAGGGEEAAGAEALRRRRCRSPRQLPRHQRPPVRRRHRMSDLSKASRRSLKRKDHAASSHQACRRLRVGQGTQGLGRRTNGDRQEEGPSAPPHPHHADDAETRRGDPRRRLALLGDPRRDRSARKDHRDRAVPRQGRHRPMPPRDAAQGDRGVAAADAPVPGLALSHRGCRAGRPDKSAASSVAAMPEPMRRELRDLGLL